MVGAGVDAKMPCEFSAEAVVGQHAGDGEGHGACGMFGEHAFVVGFFDAAWVSGMALVFFVL